ncbi:hypothetical protein MA04_02972 [Alcanivorax balearicus MACL04]|uniref:DNA mimic protein DMP19 C-terminal domain-containing protein n=1 Tax=Alloalcanivorax balearicus MACL04 TaxID=1177182 RepID=A0ABT2R1U0_9GAMM|nr:DMP19 family protein [Alloalcanivorax balearicus]MCU5783672.1 hypothetical protein [Alloalcanivorax balearicus MACL04]
MQTDTLLTPEDAILIPVDVLGSDDPDDIIGANIDVLNALFSEYLGIDEVSREALVSYYVDYYLAQINNGGFSQFVYNSGWADDIVERVRGGLDAMGARRHQSLFEQGVALVAELGPDQLQTFFESDYFGDNPIRDRFEALSDPFYAAQETENLSRLNADWLKAHPKLLALSDPDLEREITRRAEAIPNRAERIAQALNNEPDYMKRIRALCAEAGQALEQVTAGDPSHEYQGHTVLAWHFLTDRGHHFMVEADGKAMMFDGTSGTKVAEIPY